VLEIAAGTGAVTRALVSALGDGKRILATDLNEAMLARAKSRPGADGVVWQQADSASLPFEDKAFDTAVCQFGVMFFPDKARAHAEVRRVLKPGGRYFFSVWDRLPTSEFAQIVTDTLGEMFPDDPPLFMARTPHGYHDEDRIREDLIDGGFADTDIETVSFVSRGASARDVAIAYCQGTPLRNEIEARAPNGLEEATERATEKLTRRYGSGPVEGSIRALVVTAAG
jgi:SAM-dependent methyltransferase